MRDDWGKWPVVDKLIRSCNPCYCCEGLLRCFAYFPAGELGLRALVTGSRWYNQLKSGLRLELGLALASWGAEPGSLPNSFSPRKRPSEPPSHWQWVTSPPVWLRHMLISFSSCFSRPGRIKLLVWTCRHDINKQTRMAVLKSDGNTWLAVPRVYKSSSSMLLLDMSVPCWSPFSAFLTWLAPCLSRFNSVCAPPANLFIHLV